ncbi:dihydrofolate reductase family protein [uncultured Psychroserpens sp.]|uniref:dihydrofolate reductase family protein n=1 Tax=uncultured Psychroserpens sp. TaxID=255436 RepID=UPI00261FAC81|nr:dihydrofolate reductase family protein [uncultured Psychroserpens sp.]
MSKVTIHMVSSLDGFIAKKDGTVSWLQSKDTYDKGITLSQEDIENYLKTIHCYVMGSKTYEHALELGWPYGDKPVYVLSHRPLRSDKKNVMFFSGDINKLITQELKPKYENIWVVGGAMITKEVIRLKLANEIIISMIPIILGDGTLFFDFIGQEHNLHLKDVTAYKDGMVELTYDIKQQ